MERQIIVELTLNELLILHAVGHLRIWGKTQKASHMPYRGQGNWDAWRVNYDAACSEYCTANRYLEETSMDFSYRPYGDNGIDWVYRGWLGDSKFTYQHGGHLIFNSLPLFRADIAVLVTPTSPPVYNQYLLAGWIWRYDFDRLHFEDDFGKGRRVAVRQDSLQPMYLLKLIAPK